eukprot:7168767-Prymnesium_polylepis.2
MSGWGSPLGSPATGTALESRYGLRNTRYMSYVHMGRQLEAALSRLHGRRAVSRARARDPNRHVIPGVTECVALGARRARETTLALASAPTALAVSAAVVWAVWSEQIAALTLKQAGRGAVTTTTRRGRRPSGARRGDGWAGDM